MAEEIKKFSEIVEEGAAQGNEVDYPEPFDVEEIHDGSVEVLSDYDDALPEELQTKAAKDLLSKIDEGIRLAELGVKQYFNSSPKRAVEFQQNHIAYLELKAKILKLISDTKSSVAAQNMTQNNIIIDPETAESLKEKLVKRLYGATTGSDTGSK